VIRLSYDTLVLAGGRARRLGGVSKPDLMVAGRRLLAHVLGAVEGPDVRRVVVVGPETLEVPPGVMRTLEDPPGGGPVAGIAAGFMALGNGAEPGWVLVLACDVPRVAGAVPGLAAAAGAARPGVDGVLLVDDDGRDQPLVGLYRRASLVAALARLDEPDRSAPIGTPRGVRGASVRALISSLALVRLTDTGHHATDVDTWGDVRALDVGGPDASDRPRDTMAGRADARPDHRSEPLPDAGGAA
jgi:molybdopterin-guanine dinucleotide biosynthesis protein A